MHTLHTYYLDDDTRLEFWWDDTDPAWLLDDPECAEELEAIKRGELLWLAATLAERGPCGHFHPVDHLFGITARDWDDAVEATDWAAFGSHEPGATCDETGLPLDD